MPDVVTIRQAVQRARVEGLPISEYCLRNWIRTGEIPVRRVGSKALVYFPALVDFLRCADGGDNQPDTVAESPGIRRLEVRP